MLLIHGARSLLRTVCTAREVGRNLDDLASGPEVLKLAVASGGISASITSNRNNPVNARWSRLRAAAHRLIH